MLNEVKVDEKTETWKDVLTHSGSYVVSDMGRVKNIRRAKGKFLKGNPVSKRYAYRMVNLSVNNKVTKIYIHRLVAIHFIPNPFGKPFVNHLNGIPNDNRAENLEWTTPKENIQHAYRTGLVATWIKVKQGAKLTDEQVISIRLSRSSAVELANTYKVTPNTIRDVLKRNTWKHI